MNAVRNLMRRAHRLLADHQGATSVEYAMICAVIVLIMLVALREVASGTITMWGDVSTQVQAAH